MIFPVHRADRLSLRLLLPVGLLGCLCAIPLWAEEPPLSSNVWQSVPDQFPVPRKPWVLRDRSIALNQPVLQSLKDAAARPHPRVFVELFDGARYELDITSTISRINDSSAVRGLLKNTAHGDFFFFINGTVMAGTINVGDRKSVV